MNSRIGPISPAAVASLGETSVLVVDDSRVQRHILAAYLRKWGYSVREAASAEEALAALEDESIRIVISDWVMPGLSGLDLCRALRAAERRNYVYFILLTSNSEKEDIVAGLDIGADDFLTKPVSAPELKARIRAGERILGMEAALNDKSRQIAEALDEIRTLYDALDRDLIEGRALQQSLVRERVVEFGDATVSLLLRPSGHVGGDLVGCFPIGPREFGFYSIDVSGHGIAAALLTARLAAYFSGANPEHNLALVTDVADRPVARAPAETADDLNRLMHREFETEHYLTMQLGILTLDHRGGARLAFVNCGHPAMLIQRRDGSIQAAGAPSFPVGLLEEATWRDEVVLLAPGDRLLLASDGFLECPGKGGAAFEQVGLTDFLADHRDVGSTALLDMLVWELSDFAGEAEFPDDVSAVLVEIGPPPTLGQS